MLHLLDRFPVVGILGARQVGKTTLVRDLLAEMEQPLHFFDLESPRDRGRLREPELALERLDGLVVLDEVRRIPEIFTVLRVLVDRPSAPARFLILGSASPELLHQSSESLAGRIAYHQLDPLALDEVPGSEMERLWIRGGFPRSYLASSEADSLELDLLVVAGTTRIGFEFKRTVSPRITKSLRSAIETLHLDRAYVVHAGGHTFPLAQDVEALAAGRLLTDLEPLDG